MTEHTVPADSAPGQSWVQTGRCAWVLEDDDAAVLLPFSTGRPMVLSPTGTVIWDVLLGGAGPDRLLTDQPADGRTTVDLLAELGRVFSVEPEQIREDVLGFLEELSAAGILRAVPAAPPAAP